MRKKILYITSLCILAIAFLSVMGIKYISKLEENAIKEVQTQESSKLDAIASSNEISQYGISIATWVQNGAGGSGIYFNNATTAVNGTYKCLVIQGRRLAYYYASWMPSENIESIPTAAAGYPPARISCPNSLNEFYWEASTGKLYFRGYTSTTSYKPIYVTGSGTTATGLTISANESNIIKKTVYSVTPVSTSNGGSVSGGGTTIANTAISIRAQANTGYIFAGWYTNSNCTGSAVSTSTSYTVYPTTNVTYYAKFTANNYSVSLKSNSTVMGSVSGGGSFAYNSKTTITASPKYGYRFVGWYSNSAMTSLVTTNTVYTLTVSGNTTYYAKFTPIKYQVSALSTDTAKGTVSGGGSLDYGTKTTITAQAKTGYSFAGWYTNSSCTGNPVSTASSYQFTVSGTVNYYAKFSINQYAVSVSTANSTMGTVTGGGYYNYGSTATITATAKPGYKFDAFYYGTQKFAINPMKVTVNSNKSYIAKFTAINYYLKSDETHNMTYGEALNIGSQTKDGYTFVGYKFTGLNEATAEYSLNGTTYYPLKNNVTVNAKYLRNLTTTENATVIVSLEWSINSYTKAVASNGTNFGDVSIKIGASVSKGSISVPFGSSYSVTATPKTGYKFDGWYLDASFKGEAVCTDLTYTISSANSKNNETYYAKFIQDGIHVGSNYLNNEDVKQFNNLKDAIAYAVKSTDTSDLNIYIDGPIGSLYQNYNTFINNTSSYINYTSNKNINIIGIGSNNIIYNNAANAMIVVRDGSINFENVTIYGTGKNNISGNQDNALLQLKGGDVTLGKNVIVTNNYNIGSGIHYSQDWCPGVIDVNSGVLTIKDNAQIKGNTTTYGGAIFVHGGALVMQGGSISGSNNVGIYATNSSDITISGSANPGSIYLESRVELKTSSLQNEIEVYAAERMQDGAIFGKTDETAFRITGSLNTTTGLVGKNTNGILSWSEVSLPKSKLQLAIERANTDKSFTIIQGETVSLASSLGKYVYHLNGCLSIGNVVVDSDLASVSGTGKRAVITGKKVGVIEVTLNKVSTRGCYYYGTTYIETITIQITVLPRVGSIAAGNDSISITDCDPNNQYTLYDVFGNAISSLKPMQDEKTKEYYVRFEGLNALTQYTVTATQNKFTSTEQITTPNKSALQIAIENASGFYMDQYQNTTLASIIGKYVYHLSGCINIANVECTKNPENINITGTGKYTKIEALKPGYVDLTMDVKTNGWCAVYGNVSTWIEDITIRIYILPTLKDSDVIITTNSISLPDLGEGFSYKLGTEEEFTTETILNLTSNKSYTLDIRYTFNDGTSVELIGYYQFTTLLDTTSKDTIIKGIEEKTNDLKEKLEQLNISDKLYESVNKIVNKLTENLVEKTESELKELNEVIDGLINQVIKVDGLDPTNENHNKLSDNLDELFNKIAGENDVNIIYNKLAENKDFIEKVDSFNKIIENLDGNDLEALDEALKKYDELSADAKDTVNDQFEKSVEKYYNYYKTQIIHLTNVDTATKTKIFSLLDEKYNSLQSSLDKIYEMKLVYDKAIAIDKLSAFDKQELNRVTDVTINDILGITIQGDAASSGYLVAKSSLDTEVIKQYNVIAKASVDEEATSLGVSVPNSYEYTKIIKDTTGYKYNDNYYTSYEEALNDSILNDKLSLIITSIELTITGAKTSFRDEALDVKNNDSDDKTINENLIARLEEYLKEYTSKINSTTSYEEAKSLMTELESIIKKVEISKIDNIKNIISKNNITDVSYNQSLKTTINSSKEESISTIILATSEKIVSSTVNEFNNLVLDSNKRNDSISKVNSALSGVADIHDDLKETLDTKIKEYMNGVLGENNTAKISLAELSSKTIELLDFIAGINQKAEALKTIDSFVTDGLSETFKEDFKNIKDEYKAQIISAQVNEVDSLVNRTSDAYNLILKKDEACKNIAKYAAKISEIIKKQSLIATEKDAFINSIASSVNNANSSIKNATSTSDIYTAKDSSYAEINAILNDVDTLVTNRNTTSNEVKTLINESNISGYDTLLKALEEDALFEINRATTLDEFTQIKTKVDTIINEFKTIIEKQNALSSDITDSALSEELKTLFNNAYATIVENGLNTIEYDLIDTDRQELITKINNQLNSVEAIFNNIKDITNITDATKNTIKTLVKEELDIIINSSDYTGITDFISKVNDVLNEDINNVKSNAKNTIDQLVEEANSSEAKINIALVESWKEAIDSQVTIFDINNKLEDIIFEIYRLSADSTPFEKLANDYVEKVKNQVEEFKNNSYSYADTSSFNTSIDIALNEFISNLPMTKDEFIEFKGKIDAIASEKNIAISSAKSLATNLNVELTEENIGAAFTEGANIFEAYNALVTYLIEQAVISPTNGYYEYMADQLQKDTIKKLEDFKNESYMYFDKDAKVTLVGTKISDFKNSIVDNEANNKELYNSLVKDIETLINEKEIAKESVKAYAENNGVSLNDSEYTALDEASTSTQINTEYSKLIAIIALEIYKSDTIASLDKLYQESDFDKVNDFGQDDYNQSKAVIIGAIEKTDVDTAAKEITNKINLLVEKKAADDEIENIKKELETNGYDTNAFPWYDYHSTIVDSPSIDVLKTKFDLIIEEINLKVAKLDAIDTIKGAAEINTTIDSITINGYINQINSQTTVEEVNQKLADILLLIITPDAKDKFVEDAKKEIDALNNLSSEQKNELKEQIDSVNNSPETSFKDIIEEIEKIIDNAVIENGKIESSSEDLTTLINTLQESISTAAIDELSNLTEEEKNSYKASVNDLVNNFATDAKKQTTADSINNLFAEYKDKINTVLQEATDWNNTKATIQDTIDQAINDIKVDIASKEQIYGDIFKDFTDIYLNDAFDSVKSTDEVTSIKSNILALIVNVVENLENKKIAATTEIQNKINKAISEVEGLNIPANAKKDIIDAILDLGKDINFDGKNIVMINTIVNTTKNSIDNLVTAGKTLETSYNDIKTTIDGTTYESLNITNIDDDSYKAVFNKIKDDALAKIDDITTLTELNTAKTLFDSEVESLKEAAEASNAAYNEIQTKIDEVTSLLESTNVQDNDLESFTNRINQVVVEQDVIKLITDKTLVDSTKNNIISKLDTICKELENYELTDIRIEYESKINQQMSLIKYQITISDQLNNKDNEEILQKLNDLINKIDTNLISCQTEDEIKEKTQIILDEIKLISNKIEKTEELFEFLTENKDSLEKTDLYTEIKSSIEVAIKKLISDATSNVETVTNVYNEKLNDVKTTISDKFDKETSLEANSSLNKVQTKEELDNQLEVIDNLEKILIDSFGVNKNEAYQKTLENYLDIKFSELFSNVDNIDNLEIIGTILDKGTSIGLENFNQEKIYEEIETIISDYKEKFAQNITDSNYDSAYSNKDKYDNAVKVYEEASNAYQNQNQIDYSNSLSGIIEEKFNGNEAESGIIDSFINSITNLSDLDLITSLVDEIIKLNDLYSSSIKNPIEGEENSLIIKAIEKIISSIGEAETGFINSLLTETDFATNKDFYINSNEALVKAYNTLVDEYINKSQDEITYPKDKYDEYTSDTLNSLLDSLSEDIISEVISNPQESITSKLQASIDEYFSLIEKYEAFTIEPIDYKDKLNIKLEEKVKEYAKTTAECLDGSNFAETNYIIYNYANELYKSLTSDDSYDQAIIPYLKDSFEQRYNFIKVSGEYREQYIPAETILIEFNEDIYDTKTSTFEDLSNVYQDYIQKLTIIPSATEEVLAQLDNITRELYNEKYFDQAGMEQITKIIDEFKAKIEKDKTVELVDKHFEDCKNALDDEKTYIEKIIKKLKEEQEKNISSDFYYEYEESILNDLYEETYSKLNAGIIDSQTGLVRPLNNTEVDNYIKNQFNPSFDAILTASEKAVRDLTEKLNSLNKNNYTEEVYNNIVKKYNKAIEVLSKNIITSDVDRTVNETISLNLDELYNILIDEVLNNPQATITDYYRDLIQKFDSLISVYSEYKKNDVIPYKVNFIDNLEEIIIEYASKASIDIINNVNAENNYSIYNYANIIYCDITKDIKYNHQASIELKEEILRQVGLMENSGCYYIDQLLEADALKDKFNIDIDTYTTLEEILDMYHTCLDDLDKVYTSLEIATKSLEDKYDNYVKTKIYSDDNLVIIKNIIEEFKTTASFNPISLNVSSCLEDATNKIAKVPTYIEQKTEQLEELRNEIEDSKLYYNEQMTSINNLIYKAIIDIHDVSNGRDLYIDEVDAIISALAADIDNVLTATEIGMSELDEYFVGIIPSYYTPIAYNKILDLYNKAYEELQNNLLTTNEVSSLVDSTKINIDLVESIEEQSFTKVKAEAIKALDLYINDSEDFAEVNKIIEDAKAEISAIKPNGAEAKDEVVEILNNAIKEILDGYKEVINNTLDKLDSNYNEKDYTSDKYESILDIIADSKADVPNIDSIEELKDYILNLEEVIASVPTILDEAKDVIKEEINSLVDDILNNYELTDEQINKLEEFITDANEKINATTSLDNLDTIKNSIVDDYKNLSNETKKEIIKTDIYNKIDELITLDFSDEKWNEIKTEIDNLIEDYKELDSDTTLLDRLEEVESLNDKKEAIDSINDYFEALDEDDYSKYSYEKIVTIKDETINAIKDLTDSSLIEETKTSGLNQIDEIQTLTEESLENAIDNATKILDGYKDGSSNVDLIIDQVKSTLDSLEDGATGLDVNVLVNQAIVDIYNAYIENIAIDYKNDGYLPITYDYIDEIIDSYKEQMNNVDNSFDASIVFEKLNNDLELVNRMVSTIEGYKENASDEVSKLIDTTLDAMKNSDSLVDITREYQNGLNLIENELLKEAKIEAENQLQQLYEKLISNEGTYSPEKYTELEELYNEAIDNINSSFTIANVISLKDKAIEDMNNVPNRLDEAIDLVTKELERSDSDDMKELVDKWVNEISSITINSEGMYEYDGEVFDSLEEAISSVVSKANKDIEKQLAIEAIMKTIEELTKYKNSLIETNRFSDSGIASIEKVHDEALSDLDLLDPSDANIYDSIETVKNVAYDKYKDILADFTTTTDGNMGKDTSDVDYSDDYDYKQNGFWGNVSVNDDSLTIDTTLAIDIQDDIYLELAKEVYEEKKTEYSLQIDPNKSELKLLLDVYLVRSNERLKLDGTSEIYYTVRMLIPDEYRNTRELSIVHIADDGSLEFYTTKVINNYLEFTTTHFSDYALAGMTYLEQYREEQIENVYAHFASIDSSIYTHEQWAIIRGIYNETLKALEGKTITAPDMSNIYLTFTDEINSVPTALDEKKTEALKQLEEEFKAINKEDYSEDEYNKIKDAYKKTKTQIQNAPDFDSVDIYLKDGITRINSATPIYVIIWTVVGTILGLLLLVMLLLFLFFFEVRYVDEEGNIVLKKRSFWLFSFNPVKHTPIKENYTLIGVYSDKEFKNKAEKFRMPFGKVVLYTKWIRDKNESIEVISDNSFTTTPYIKEEKTLKIESSIENINKKTVEPLKIKITPAIDVEKEENTIDNENNEEEVYNLDPIFNNYAKEKSYAPLVSYSISFEAKLALGDDDIRNVYNEIKNAILSFNKVKSRMSFKKETFYIGRTVLAVLQIRGKKINLYVPKVDALVEEVKIKTTDVSERKSLAKTPTCIKLSSSLQMKKLMILLPRLMEEYSIAKLDEYNYEDYASKYKGLTKEELIHAGLIKMFKKKQIESVTVSEANELMSDQELNSIVISKEYDKIEGKKTIVNLDIINEAYEENDIVDLKSLKAKGLIGKNTGYVKVLARGSIDKSLMVKANSFSKEAMKMIILTGGDLVIVEKK